MSNPYRIPDRSPWFSEGKLPAGPLEWGEANRQANRERIAAGEDWRWWDRRRRELAGWPDEGRERWANRAAWVDALVAHGALVEHGGRPHDGDGLMALWDVRRRELAPEVFGP